MKSYGLHGSNSFRICRNRPDEGARPVTGAFTFAIVLFVIR